METHKTTKKELEEFKIATSGFAQRGARKY